jgi:putative phosphoesterase
VAQSVLDELSKFAPTTAVAGNMDPPEVARRLNDRELLHLEGATIGLKHGHQPHGIQAHYIDCSYESPQMELFYQLMSAQLPGADVIVFGHFHHPVIQSWHGITFINPGAVAAPSGRASFALLELTDEVDARIVPLP